MRFTLCWKTAVTFPITRVTAVRKAISSCQCSCSRPKPSWKSRRKAKKAAPFTMVAMKAV